MRRRHLPHVWLMTDERMGEELWDSLDRLPRGAGVVFRHHATPPAERRRMFAKVSRIARSRGLTLVRAGALAMRGEGGVHNRVPRTCGLKTFAVHSRRDAVAAERAGADLVFVSPVFTTRSHLGGRPLGAVRLGLLVRGVRVPVVALGGMDARTFRQVRALRIYGWAGIDAWLGGAPQRSRVVGRSFATPAGLGFRTRISER